MRDGIFLQKEYGRVIITLKDALESQSMTRNNLAKLTGLGYNTIDRYYKNGPTTSVDLDILARICFVLNCQISDLLKYEFSSPKPEADN